MVVDNLDQPGDFPDNTFFFPQAPRGAVLLTSRHAASERLGNTVSVTGMTENEALELLLRQSKAERNHDTMAASTMIVRRLELFPLAIDQAVAYICSCRLPLAQFLSHFNVRREAVLQHTPEFWEYRRRLGDGKNETKLSVFTTWDLSFRKLRRSDTEREHIRHFLTLALLYDFIRIGEDIFSSGPAAVETPPLWMGIFESDNAWDQYKFEEVVVEVFSLSYLQTVEVAGATISFSLHPLVADWLHPRREPENHPHALEAISILG